MSALRFVEHSTHHGIKEHPKHAEQHPNSENANLFERRWISEWAEWPPGDINLGWSMSLHRRWTGVIVSERRNPLLGRIGQLNWRQSSRLFFGPALLVDRTQPFYRLRPFADPQNVLESLGALARDGDVADVAHFEAPCMRPPWVSRSDLLNV